MSCDLGEVTESHSRAHSPTFPSLHLRHSSFPNPSVASPTSQLILQPFRCFTYVTAHSPTLLSLLLRHRLFTYVTWRAAHGSETISYKSCNGIIPFNPQYCLQRVVLAERPGIDPKCYHGTIFFICITLVLTVTIVCIFEVFGSLAPVMNDK